jgi:hypothetical protein
MLYRNTPRFRLPDSNTCRRSCLPSTALHVTSPLHTIWRETPIQIFTKASSNTEKLGHRRPAIPSSKQTSQPINHSDFYITFSITRNFKIELWGESLSWEVMSLNLGMVPSYPKWCLLRFSSVNVVNAVINWHYCRKTPKVQHPKSQYHWIKFQANSTQPTTSQTKINFNGILYSPRRFTTIIMNTSWLPIWTTQPVHFNLLHFTIITLNWMHIYTGCGISQLTAAHYVGGHILGN